MGYSKVMLEVDSLCAVQLCSEVSLDLHVCRPLVLPIRSLYQHIGEVQIVYQFREANACANLLAKQGHCLHPGFHVFPNLPSFISVNFHVDFSSVTYPWIFAM